MDFDVEYEYDDDWSFNDYNPYIIRELNCAFCNSKMTRRGLNFTCPYCGCRCFTDEEGNTEWDTKKFKGNPSHLVTTKQKRAIWICNHYGGRDFFTLNKDDAKEFLSKYFEESCAMKEAQEEQMYEDMLEEGLLPDESELF